MFCRDWRVPYDGDYMRAGLEILWIIFIHGNSLSTLLSSDLIIIAVWIIKKKMRNMSKSIEINPGNHNMVIANHSSSSSLSNKSSSSPTTCFLDPSATALHVGTSNDYDISAMAPRLTIRYLIMYTAVLSMAPPIHPLSWAFPAISQSSSAMPSPPSLLSP